MSSGFGRALLLSGTPARPAEGAKKGGSPSATRPARVWTVWASRPVRPSLPSTLAEPAASNRARVKRAFRRATPLEPWRRTSGGRGWGGSSIADRPRHGGFLPARGRFPTAHGPGIDAVAPGRCCRIRHGGKAKRECVFTRQFCLHLAISLGTGRPRYLPYSAFGPLKPPAASLLAVREGGRQPILPSSFLSRVCRPALSRRVPRAPRLMSADSGHGDFGYLSRPSGGRGPGRGGPGPPCAFKVPMITAFCNSH